MTQGPDQIHAALKAAIEIEIHAYLWTPSDGRSRRGRPIAAEDPK